MTVTKDFLVRFWGARGSIPCSGESVNRYGGDTSCVEVRCGDQLLILDAGTGIRSLGHMLKESARISADIFLSHTHLDHIIGFPFFRPGYDSQNAFRVWAGHLLPADDIKSAICGLMRAPFFPVPVEGMRADVSFHDFHAGDVLEPAPGIRLRTVSLNHPNRATGYRIEFAGKSVCYVTDTEHRSGERDEAILDLIDSADIVIYDAQYSDEEYPAFRGFGHSTWQEGLRLVKAANAGVLVAFHHDPDHDDAFLERVEEALADAWPGSILARAGLLLRP
jgi:phosphoribosyl 1,2-cyclic phosphodiesterase